MVKEIFIVNYFVIYFFYDKSFYDLEVLFFSYNLNNWKFNYSNGFFDGM